MSDLPPSHLQADFSRWKRPGPGDKRSPCPLLNSLANHHFIPHNRTSISKEMIQEGACKAGDVKPENIGNIFASGAKPIPEAQATGRLNLDQLDMNGVLEHDASISRQDHALGDSLHLDPQIWRGVLDVIGDRKTVDYATAAKIRHMRIATSKRAHAAANKPGNLDLKALLISYIEISVLFQLFADTQTHEIPVSYFRTFFEEERFPYKEGWRPYHGVKSRPRIQIILLSIVFADTKILFELLSAAMVTLRNLLLGALHMFGVHTTKRD